MIKQSYFLGGVSPLGFNSKFNSQLEEPGYYAYILKGGPGTGKSTLMKKAAKALEDSQVSLYYCSSDTKSLDAVVDEDRKIIIADGTAPHVMDPVYPGVSQEIINLGHFWDSEKLRSHADAVRYLCDENQKCHARVRCYVKALGSLNGDIYTVGSDALDRVKLDAYISRLCRKSVNAKKDGSKGRLCFRQLSAFTTENYKTLPLSGDYSVYLLKDDCFAGSDYFLKAVTDILINSGHDVTVSECMMHYTPVYEHIFSETAGIAFMTSGFYNKLEDPSAAVINFGRFYDKDVLAAKKQRLAFDRRAFSELAEEGADTLTQALAIHDELEKKYIQSIDFERLNEFTEKFIDSLKSLPKS